MLKSIINEFRQANGQGPADMRHWQEDQYCLFHCKYMAYIQGRVHSPWHLRPGKSEAVANGWYFRDCYDALRAVIFDTFGNSIEHRNLLLFSSSLACAHHTEENRLIYVTIRGWC